MSLLPSAPNLPGGADVLIRLFDRVMAGVGNEWSTANFVITHQDLNKIKNNLMRGENPIALTRLPGLCSNYDNPQYVLARARTSIGIIHYLNNQGTPNIDQRLTNIINDVGDQWFHGHRSYNQLNHTTPVAVGEFWCEWAKDLFNTFIITHTRDIATECIRKMKLYWGVSTHERTDEIFEILSSFEDELNHLNIDTSGFH